MFYKIACKIFTPLIISTKMNIFTRSLSSNLEKHRAKIMSKGLPTKTPITGVKNIILVASGKGGVGKSTIAVNVAAGLKSIYPEKEVGILDTDVFGPSVPLMMNLKDTPLLNEKNQMIPLINYGIKCMSMGFLIEEGAPIIWRGLMVMQALEKLLRQVDWGHIDYLIIDTPPGTGDTHLSIIQNIPISGVILVTTPQSASLQVTKRGAVMFKKLQIPIIGIVENMATIKCTSCNENFRIFGDGTLTLATDIQTNILESLPLESETSSSTDKGIPIVFSNAKSLQTQNFQNLARSVVKFLNN